jgi:hypothetical protein
MGDTRWFVKNTKSLPPTHPTFSIPNPLNPNLHNLNPGLGNSYRQARGGHAVVGGKVMFVVLEGPRRAVIGRERTSAANAVFRGSDVKD